MQLEHQVPVRESIWNLPGGFLAEPRILLKSNPKVAETPSRPWHGAPPAMTAYDRILLAADRDLADQVAYLESQASVETALRLYAAARSTFAKLADVPGIGERWPSTNRRPTGTGVSRIKYFGKHLIG